MLHDTSIEDRGSPGSVLTLKNRGERASERAALSKISRIASGTAYDQDSDSLGLTVHWYTSTELSSAFLVRFAASLTECILAPTQRTR